MGIDELMRQMNKDLSSDYILPGEKEPSNCGYIAATLAHALIQEGKQVDLLEIRGSSGDELRPIRFPNITWFSHIVCCSEGKAYEPLLGQVIPQGQYSKMLLGEERKLLPKYNHDETIKLIEFYECNKSII